MKIKEDEPVNAPSMSADAIADYPMPLGGKKWKMFNVSPKIWRRFEPGKRDSKEWLSELDLKDSQQKEIFEYAKQNKNKTIVLRDSSTGKLKAIRRNISK